MSVFHVSLVVVRSIESLLAAWVQAFDDLSILMDSPMVTA
jgi:hypothetical protein